MTVVEGAAVAVPAERGRADRTGVLVCLAGAALAAAVVPLVGAGLAGDTGAEVTDSLVTLSARLQLAAVLAAVAAALLLPAAVRLGRHVGGTAGGVATVAGSAVALMMAAMYAAFGAGAVVATLMLTDPSPAVGEGTLLLVNLVELTRYAPSAALVVAALAARRVLPRPLVAVAGLLLLLTLVPMTTWLVALLVPVWLGVAGALVPGRR